MNTPIRLSLRKNGFSLVEVLVSMIILLVGLLGLAGLMVQSQRSEMESYQRAQALILLQDMAGRISANRNVASCYTFTTATNGAYLGTAQTAALPVTCTVGTVTPTPAQVTQLNVDLDAWNKLLQGASETYTDNATLAISNIGALAGARGCIYYDATQAVKDRNGNYLTGSGDYVIAIAWQGLNDTFAPPGGTPALNCGQNQYGAETKRRIVSLIFKAGAINNTI